VCITTVLKVTKVQKKRKTNQSIKPQTGGGREKGRKGKGGGIIASHVRYTACMESRSSACEFWERRKFDYCTVQ